MSDETYAAEIYMTDGGDEMVVNGGIISNNGTQASHIADAGVAYTSGDLDTAAEIAVALNATNTKINSILAALEGVGILADS